MDDTTTAAGPSPTPERITMGRQGRLVVPAAMRRTLGLEEGTSLVIRIDDDGLRIQSLAAVVNRWRGAFRPRGVGAEVSFVDEYLREKRAEVEREERAWHERGAGA